MGRLRARLDAQPAALGLLLVVAPLLLIYLITANTGPNQVNDTVATAVPAHTLAWEGTATLDEYAGRNAWFMEFDGRVVSNRHPGTILLAVPFYRVLGGPELSFAPGAVTAALVAALAMGVLYLVLRRVVSPSTAMAGALVAGLATSTWSVSADALWNHGPDQLWLGLGLLGLAAGRYLPAGLAFGLALLTRPHTGVVAAVAGLHRSLAERRIWPAVAIAATTALGLAAFLWYGHVVFGQASLTGGHSGTAAGRVLGSAGLAGEAARLAENVAGTLVSPNRGILTLSPFLLLLLPGLPAAWRAAPGWVRSAALAGATYMLVQLRVNYFDGGLNLFAYRLPLEMLTMAAPLLVLSYRGWVAGHTRRVQAFWTLVALSVAIQFLGAAVFVRDPSVVAIRDTTVIGWGAWELTAALSRLGPAGVAGLGMAVALVWPLTGALLADRGGRRARPDLPDVAHVADLPA